MVRVHAAQTRVMAYVSPSRCVLDATEDNLALWFNDARQSDTVHASEVRWLTYDQSIGSLVVWWVAFPHAMSDSARAAADIELESDSDWQALLAEFNASGLVTSVPLVDGLRGVAIATDHADPARARQVLLSLSFARDDVPLPVTIAAAIQQRMPPLGG
jgi:hypothetical protein